MSTIFGHRPSGPSSAGCPLGRQCLPPNGYTVSESTSISTSVERPEGNLFAVWADFRNNTNDDCQGAAGTWRRRHATTTSSTRTPTDRKNLVGKATSDHTAGRIHASERRRSGCPGARWLANGHLWVCLLRPLVRQLRANQGCNDITAAEITNPATPSPTYSFHRVTTDSMPNLTAQNNPLQAGFIGDQHRDRHRQRQLRAHRLDRHAASHWGNARGGCVLRPSPSASSAALASSASARGTA